MKILKRTIMMFLIAAFFVSCNNKESTDVTDKAKNKIEESKSLNIEKSFEGSYVSDDYSKRNENYDWVAVTITKSTDSIYNVSVRSRVDIKKPSCTFDTKAVKTAGNVLTSSENGFHILFTMIDSSLVISTGKDEDRDKLAFYCSGGATFAGPYVKINEPLDKKQIDPRVFQKFLTLQDISFDISSTGEGSIQKLTIQPTGLSIDNNVITTSIDGRITNAEIEDLNSDGSPELLIYTTSAGSGSYGNVIAYSVNNGKSLSPVFFPPVADNPKVNNGYMGHDEFAVVENRLVQRFPIYNEGDINSKPTGNIRQISYKLEDGEASRKFVADKIVEIVPE